MNHAFTRHITHTHTLAINFTARACMRRAAGPGPDRKRPAQSPDSQSGSKATGSTPGLLLVWPGPAAIQRQHEARTQHHSSARRDIDVRMHAPLHAPRACSCGISDAPAFLGPRRAKHITEESTRAAGQPHVYTCAHVAMSPKFSSGACAAGRRAQ